jgi:hypothetical protein
VLEEMAKEMLDGEPKLLLKPTEIDHLESISGAPPVTSYENKYPSLHTVTNMDKVV